MTDGILLIDKPAGISSFGVVARVRGALSRIHGRKTKVGHTGTLDPFATGLMILVVGKECKNAARYSKLDKVYEATLCLGRTSSTGDPEGEIGEVNSRQPERSELESVLREFEGEITQTPPVYSAIKIGGRRAYQLARKGVAVEMPSRQVKVFSLELINYEYPYVYICAHVSSGTYIRTLGADIGARLGVGAYTTALRRTKIGAYDIEQAVALDEWLLRFLTSSDTIASI